VNIGGALAEARSEAGLTITQVSERTRIRETIIRDIERDVYSACGGDYYARGHIRAIARVVGADPVPLIEEYDAARLPPPEPAAAGRAKPDHAPPGRVRPAGLDPDADTDPDLLDGVTSGRPDTVLDSARRWLSARHVRRAGAGHAPPGLPAYSPPGITAAEAFRPGLPMDFERRRPRRAGLLALVALAIVGVVVYLLVSAHSSPRKAPATTRSHRSAAAVAREPSATAGTTTRAAAARQLAIMTAAAFGPAGTSQGDDPQDAALAIDDSVTTAWHSDWYATAQLGGLQSGTGLLLGLGNADTIMSATIMLGPTPGGTIELRAGDTPALANLPVVARAASPGGRLTMRLSVPVRARFALIWFTSLPPDGAGTYEAYVYDVRLAGTA
jgi:transcriptional regulator with XRE-family HTH domain